jgi:hypothetical protein
MHYIPFFILSLHPDMFRRTEHHLQGVHQKFFIARRLASSYQLSVLSKNVIKTQLINLKFEINPLFPHIMQLFSQQIFLRLP